jgi:hypothetical protein
MSTIRVFDSIPHIVRYGRQDEVKGESWMLFWRNAVCFTVTVSGGDVQETPFGKKWLELNKEDRTTGSIKGFVERWNALCDCIISQSMPVLQELAPPTRQWKTLEDHLRTPTYELRLVADQETGDAVAEVISGPVEKPSYEHHLLPFSEFQPMSDGLPCYQARDLACLGQEKNLRNPENWRHPPVKVQAPTGEVFYFVSCNRGAKNTSTGEVSNDSMNKINANLRLHSKAGYGTGIHIPKLMGVVVSSADRKPEDWDAKGNHSVDSWPPDGVKAQEPLVAGILVSYISKAKTLRDVTKRLADDEATEYAGAKEKWKAQISSAVQHLHDHGIAIGGRSDPDGSWAYINQYTVYVAPIELAEDLGRLNGAHLEAAVAWLMVETRCTMRPAEGDEEDMKKFEADKSMDWQAVEYLFQF